MLLKEHNFFLPKSTFRDALALKMVSAHMPWLYECGASFRTKMCMHACSQLFTYGGLPFLRHNEIHDLARSKSTGQSDVTV